MIDRELKDEVLTLRLSHGKASALDFELCEALSSELESAAAARDVRCIVLTGTGSIFSGGVDLRQLVEGGDEYVQKFVESLDAVVRSLFVFPKPAIAAINGHAIAGGAILAYACDYKLMCGGRIGTPEMLVGVPFPPIAFEMVRFAVPQQHLQSMLFLGTTIQADAAQAMGIVDETTIPEELMRRAYHIAAQFADLASEPFRLTKRQLREPYLRDAAQMARVSADEIDTLWAAPATHERIRSYIAKTIGKKQG